MAHPPDGVRRLVIPCDGRLAWHEPLPCLVRAFAEARLPNEQRERIDSVVAQAKPLEIGVQVLVN
jgi:hypothetical protein